MFRPRVIPTLLLKNKGLVKTVNFSKEKYIGDPINAVRIYNEMEADELVFLDITATIENRLPSIDLIKKISDEAFMPFTVGGGIKSIEDAKEMISAGAEKIVINSASVTKPNLITEVSNLFGKQSVIVSIDVKKNFWGKDKVYINSGTKQTSLNPLEHAKNVEKLGAGEIFLTSIDNEGLMKGYNIELCKKVSEAVNIPVIANGGAGNIQDFKQVINGGEVHAVAAGSLFVYQGPKRGVLINYPVKKELENMFDKES